MFIQTEATPNPATLKFLPGQAVLEAGTADFPGPDTAGNSPLAQRLFAVDGVTGVFFGPDFVTVTKTGDLVWDHLKPAILGAIMEHYQSGQPAVTGTGGAGGHQDHEDGPDSEIVAQIKELLDTRVRPSGGPGWWRHHLPRLRSRHRLPAYAGRLRRLPVVDPDAQDGDREPAAPLHPRSA